MQQFYSHATRSQTVLSNNVTGRAYNGSSLVTSIASSRSFYGPALPSCSINLTYKLLDSLLWVVLFSKKY